jgi:hypothetical protein
MDDIISKLAREYEETIDLLFSLLSVLLAHTDDSPSIVLYKYAKATACHMGLDVHPRRKVDSVAVPWKCLGLLLLGASDEGSSISDLPRDIISEVVSLSTLLVNYEYFFYLRTAKKNFEEAYALASEKLIPTDPKKLQVALYYGHFLYERLNDPGGTCVVFKKAFDDAIQGLDELGPEDYKDTTLLMQLMRDGMTLYTSALDEEEEEEA